MTCMRYQMESSRQWTSNKDIPRVKIFSWHLNESLITSNIAVMYCIDWKLLFWVTNIFSLNFSLWSYFVKWRTDHKIGTPSEARRPRLVILSCIFILCKIQRSIFWNKCYVKRIGAAILFHCKNFDSN